MVESSNGKRFTPGMVTSAVVLLGTLSVCAAVSFTKNNSSNKQDAPAISGKASAVGGSASSDEAPLLNNDDSPLGKSVLNESSLNKRNLKSGFNLVKNSEASGLLPSEGAKKGMAGGPVYSGSGTDLRAAAADMPVVLDPEVLAAEAKTELIGIAADIDVDSTNLQFEKGCGTQNLCVSESGLGLTSSAMSRTADADGRKPEEKTQNTTLALASANITSEAAGKEDGSLATVNAVQDAPSERSTALLVDELKGQPTDYKTQAACAFENIPGEGEQKLLAAKPEAKLEGNTTNGDSALLNMENATVKEPDNKTELIPSKILEDAVTIKKVNAEASSTNEPIDKTLGSDIINTESSEKTETNLSRLAGKNAKSGQLPGPEAAAKFDVTSINSSEKRCEDATLVSETRVPDVTNTPEGGVTTLGGTRGAAFMCDEHRKPQSSVTETENTNNDGARIESVGAKLSTATILKPEQITGARDATNEPAGLKSENMDAKVRKEPQEISVLNVLPENSHEKNQHNDGAYTKECQRVNTTERSHAAIIKYGDSNKTSSGGAKHEVTGSLETTASSNFDTALKKIVKGKFERLENQVNGADKKTKKQSLNNAKASEKEKDTALKQFAKERINNKLDATSNSGTHIVTSANDKKPKIKNDEREWKQEQPKENFQMKAKREEQKETERSLLAKLYDYLPSKETVWKTLKYGVMPAAAIGGCTYGAYEYGPGLLEKLGWNGQ